MSNDKPVRIDKWLWAARFYKTRTLAREALDGGKVRYNGYRAKPGKAAQLNANITISQGIYEKEIIIKALSDKRGPASIAQTLYEETEASIQKNAALKEARKLSPGIAPAKKPDKRQRRHIHQFKRQ